MRTVSLRAYVRVSRSCSNSRVAPVVMLNNSSFSFTAQVREDRMCSGNCFEAMEPATKSSTAPKLRRNHAALSKRRNFEAEGRLGGTSIAVKARSGAHAMFAGLCFDLTRRGSNDSGTRKERKVDPTDRIYKSPSCGHSLPSFPFFSAGTTFKKECYRLSMSRAASNPSFLVSSRA